MYLILDTTNSQEIKSTVEDYYIKIGNRIKLSSKTREYF